MNGPTSSQVLGLYRNLMRYGKQLQFTDKSYFLNRIRKEFKKKKNLTELEDIKFQYERCGLAEEQKSYVAQSLYYGIVFANNPNPRKTPASKMLSTNFVY
ncbi:Uncharacterized protein GBIM_02219 [Gryllus bimaculatus]|nr:Uncharacterized protein GBIM_02219 [Gryllus bimaculatus]